MIDKTARSAMFGRNLVAIGLALAAAGAKAYSVNYHGSGDEGGDFEHEEAPEALDGQEVDGDLLDETCLDIEFVKREWVDGAWNESVEARNFELMQAMEDMAEELIAQAGHSSYEDGLGGGGTVTFTSDGKASVHHYHTVERQVDEPEVVFGSDGVAVTESDEAEAEKADEPA